MTACNTQTKLFDKVPHQNTEPTVMSHKILKANHRHQSLANQGRLATDHDVLENHLD